MLQEGMLGLLPRQKGENLSVIAAVTSTNGFIESARIGDHQQRQRNRKLKCATQFSMHYSQDE